MKMQDTSHKAGDYARPNLNWQCGREDCCQLGPTVNGKCSDTEQLCVPQRSVKAKKRIAAIWLFSILIGVMSVFFSTSALLTRVSPGPVSMSHAEVATCEGCHTVANNDIGQWFKKATSRIIGSDTLDQHEGDKQCLSCHALGENALLAHSTSAGNFSADVNNLESLSSEGWELSLASTLRGLQMKNSEKISCSVCHQEHKSERNLRENFDSQKCHTCHEVKFDSLETGHPEYTKFPYSKPTKIKYDHSNHRGKYFFDEDYSDRAPKNCQHCHVTDQSGEWMLLNSFEETCSTCHLNDVLGMNRLTTKGVDVFTIPKFDVQTLNQAGLNIGEWPSSADGELTPFMRALLPNSLLPPDEVTLYDLSNASQEQLQTAALLAWEIKRLFNELVLGGTSVLEQRLSNTLGQTLDQSIVNRLIAALPKDTLLNNQQQWFPNLMKELADYRTGSIQLEPKIDIDERVILEAQPLNSEEKPSGNVDISNNLNSDESSILSKNKSPSQTIELGTRDEEWAVSGGWYREGSSIRYRPIDHADLFFKTWLDVSASQFGTLDHSLFELLSADESVGNCTSCHTIQTNAAKEKNEKPNAGQQVEPSYKMNWHSFQPSDVLIDFNRFSHITHFNKGCDSCHEVNAEPAVDIKNRGGQTPAVNVSASGFLNMDRNACTQCHQEGRAPDNCLTCHNYHAEPYRQRVEKILDMPEIENNSE